MDQRPAPQPRVSLPRVGQAPFEARPYPIARQAHFAYDVIIGPDPYSADPNRAILTSTGTGADNTVRVVTARIKKSNVADDPPGALHLASANAVSTSFTSSAFKIDGGDKHYGAAGLKSAIPGVSASNAANATSAENSLGHSQKAQVTGLGYIDNPRKASVSAVPKLSVSEINKIVQNLIDQPGSIQVASANVKGNISLGTIASPQVTRITGSAFTLNGSVTGAGILIIDPAVTITGNFEFNGLVIARGSMDVNTGTKKNEMGGSSLIQGSLWTTDLAFAMGGSAGIQYSSKALQYAEQAAISIGVGSFLPAPVDIIAWRERF